MNENYACIFIDAWNEVLSSFSSKKVLTADVITSQANMQPSDISVIMGLVGDVRGQVLLSMDLETGEVLASEMLGGMDVSGMTEVTVSAVGEFCNMIMGNACAGIGSVHENVDITPPTILSAEEAAALSRETSFYLSLCVEDMGMVDFDVCIKSA